jgi:glycine/serine hydroxymethyltransferase
MAVYKALLNIGDTIMGMDLSNGGHLTHGHPMSFSGKEYNVVSYTVDKETEMIDYVETTTAIIIKIDGNTIYWNGVPYTVFSEKQVEDIRYYDGP